MRRGIGAEEKAMIVGFHVYYAPEGSAESFCGYVPVVDGDLRAALAVCREIADSGRDGLPEHLYETARAAGHVCGMTAPRSEERRVGKECRIRRWQRHEKRTKKKNKRVRERSSKIRSW